MTLTEANPTAVRRMFRLIALALCVAFISSACSTNPPEVGMTYPAPTGQHSVGQALYHLTDRARAEAYTPAPDDVRELMLYVYYPARPAKREVPSAWLDETLAHAITETLEIPGQLLTRINAHLYRNAPVSDAQTSYPVLVFSHGDLVLPALYTTLLQDLASHGYIVAVVSHTYNAPVTAFPDGRQVATAPEASAAHLTLPADASFWEVSEAVWTQGQRTLDVWSADLSFVLDELAALNVEDSLLRGRLDLSRLGVMGHSVGGATATDALQYDPRVQAAANLDGSVFGIYEEGLTGPIMNIVVGDEREPEPTEEFLAQTGLTLEQFELAMSRTYARRRAFEASAVGYNVTVRGAGHNSFTDLGLLEPVLPGLADQMGDIDPARALGITSHYLLAFFGTYLNGQPEARLTGPSPYNDVLLERR